MSAELIQVIRTHLQTRGDGAKGSPDRTVTQYWSVDGKLLAEVDPWAVPEEVAAMELNDRQKSILALMDKAIDVLETACIAHSDYADIPKVDLLQTMLRLQKESE